MSIKRMNEVRLVGQVEFGAALSVFAWFVLLASQANCLQQNLLEQNLASQLGPYGGDYSSALIADNLVNLGQPNYGGIKRATSRKMSAFMPMRGRKDGRDSVSSSGFNSNNQLLQTALELGGDPSAAMLVLREAEGDPSILRLVGVSPTTWSAGSGTPAPRQFTSQFVARHLLNGANPPLQQQQRIVAGESVDGIQFDDEQVAPMMQAKLRRAFHPMRGKRAELGELALLDSEAGQADA